MTVTMDKVVELRAVANFWKYRVDETKRHLDRLIARQASQPENLRSYMDALIEMKARELAESQRGLRKAQATLGRALEISGIKEVPLAEAESLSGSEALDETGPITEQPVMSKAEKPSRAVDNGLSTFPLSEVKLPLHRPAA